MAHETNLLIDGALVPASGGRRFDSINPATEEVIAPAADASVADAQRAIAAARRAFEETSWSTDQAFRARCLHQLVAALRKHTEELRELTVAEVGVPVSLTSGPALEGTFDLTEYYANLADTYDGTVDLGRIAEVRRCHKRRGRLAERGPGDAVVRPEVPVDDPRVIDRSAVRIESLEMEFHSRERVALSIENQDCIAR